MEIRRERPADRDGIRAVHRAAFAADSEGTEEPVEVRLVDQLRDGPWWVPHLSLVAVAGDLVVGHAVASRAVLEPAGTPVLGLGPLGTIPDRQRRGIGSALMHALVGAAEALDESLVGLLGDPAFYARFGFVPARLHRVVAPDPDWGDAFQVRLLSTTPVTGLFRYAEPFDHLG